MSLTPWIAAVLNLTFPGAGYIFARKTTIGGLLFISSISSLVWSFTVSNTKPDIDNLLTFAYLFVGIVSAAHIYYQTKNLLFNKKEKEVTHRALYKNFAIGFLYILLIINYLLITANIQNYFGWSKIGVDNTIIILNSLIYSISSFIYYVISALSFLFILVISNFLQKKQKLFRRTAYLVLGTVLTVGIFILCPTDTVNVVTATMNAHKGYSGDELLASFNKERVSYATRPLTVNTSLCKVAELRVNDALHEGMQTFQSSEKWQNAQNIVAAEALDYAHITKENHVPDVLLGIATNQSTVDMAIKDWSSNIDASYMFSYERLEFGCAVVKNGIGVLIMGFDREPFKPKTNIPWNTKPYKLTLNWGIFL